MGGQGSGRAKELRCTKEEDRGVQKVHHAGLVRSNVCGMVIVVRGVANNR